MNWTKEQQQAIEFNENKSILLAAAAGSGKTAVLVERIIEKIKNKQNPTSVSELVVLTFTEAAASEMKRKIQRAIKQALKEDPENSFLKQQSLLVHSASISTVDAFCKAKLSEYSHLTDLPPGFSIISQTEGALMLKEAINNVLEKYYKNAHRLSSFRELCECLGSAKNDFKLREILTDLFNFSESMPYPAEWLCKCARIYNPENNQKNPCRNEILSQLCGDIKSAANYCFNTVLPMPEDHKYFVFYTNETKNLLKIIEDLENNDFCDKNQELANLKFPSKVRVQNTFPQEEKKADLLRELYTKNTETLKEILSAEEGESSELKISAYKRIKTLKNIVLCIGREFKRLKRAKGYLDFSDLEHEFLNLISDKNHNPSAVALSLQNRYSEILLDEYQDTNNVQEEIFRLISRDGKNIFMVGDLKQSIYKFRNAVPKLFSDKYELYENQKDMGALIRLFKNFRSRYEVVSFINGLFCEIMSKELGDVLYTEKEYLIQGAPYPAPEAFDNFNTEYHLIKFGEDETTKNKKVAKKAIKPTSDDIKIIEATFIANRIKQLTNGSFFVYDTKTETRRPAQYKDIVVLTANNSSAELVAEICAQCSVPVYTKTGQGYLSSPEVETILSFLEVIDNPFQDIPLIALMRSGIFGFSSEELAKIRTEKKDGYFFEAVLNATKNGDEKSAYLVSELKELKKLSKTASIYKLIIYILNRYNYLAMISLLDNPDLRTANLRLFTERAAEYEKTKLQGLFGFLSYLESIKEEKQDLMPAKTVSEGENVVRIMTIHKSKGLEFPIVFLADTAKTFNTDDLSGKLLRHDRGGIAICGYDGENKIIYPSSQKEILKQLEKKELLSEQIRLLYVALTRAKEKLIITAAADITPKKMQNPIYNENKIPSKEYLKSLSCFRDYISSVVLTHKNARDIREIFGLDEDIINPNADFPLEVFVDWAEDICPAAETIDEKEACENILSPSDEDIATAKEIILHAPAKEEKIPVKMAVSEVKRRLSEESQYVPRLLGGKNIFLKTKSELSAAEIGTITHFILQHINEKEIFSEQDFFDAAEKMCENGIISKPQLEAANLESAANFLFSPLGERMKKSKKVFKEYSFYSEKSAKEIFPEYFENSEDFEKSHQNILLQGTVDCFFEEENEIVLLDYKTDGITKVQAKDTAEKYRIQIECYKEAIERIFEKKVKESYICFLNCNEQIKII